MRLLSCICPKCIVCLSRGRTHWSRWWKLFVWIRFKYICLVRLISKYLWICGKYLGYFAVIWPYWYRLGWKRWLVLKEPLWCMHVKRISLCKSGIWKRLAICRSKMLYILFLIWDFWDILKVFYVGFSSNKLLSFR